MRSSPGARRMSALSNAAAVDGADGADTVTVALLRAPLHRKTQPMPQYSRRPPPGGRHRHGADAGVVFIPGTLALATTHVEQPPPPSIGNGPAPRRPRHRHGIVGFQQGAVTIEERRRRRQAPGTSPSGRDTDAARETAPCGAARARLEHFGVAGFELGQGLQIAAATMRRCSVSRNGARCGAALAPPQFRPAADLRALVCCRVRVGGGAVALRQRLERALESTRRLFAGVRPSTPGMVARKATCSSTKSGSM